MLNVMKAVVAAVMAAGSTAGSLAAGSTTPVWLLVVAAVGSGLGTFVAVYQSPPPVVKTAPKVAPSPPVNPSGGVVS